MGSKIAGLAGRELQYAAQSIGQAIARRQPTFVVAIDQSDADIAFVAMGSPRQEEWIQQHRGQIHARFLMFQGPR